MGGNLLSIVQIFILNVIFGAFNGVYVFLLNHLIIFYFGSFSPPYKGVLA